MNLRVGARTDIGRARERNEDSMLAKEPLFAVADGMGGHRGGDVASSMTLQALQEADLTADGLLAELVERIRSANRALLERGDADEALQGMGTTVTAVVVDGDTAYLAHVGDSRAYLLREGALQQLTEDHTLVQRMVRDGRITAQQAERHPQRSILTKALGIDGDLDPYELTFDLHQGDRLLLCSDGLTGMIGEQEIQQILEAEGDPQRAADGLVDAANRAGGDDNITVIVIDAGDGPAASGGSPPVGRSAPVPAAARPAGSGSMADTGVMIPVADSERHADHDVPPAHHRRRIVAWIAVTAVTLAAAFVAQRVYVSHQWYVGESNGYVAIYRGVPATVLGYELSHVEEPTSIRAAAAERFQQWQTLGDGITAESLEDARAIVAQIEQDLRGAPR